MNSHKNKKEPAVIRQERNRTMKTMTTINNGNMIKLNDEELEKINSGYILDRGSG